jgi:putative ABC transport system substrate-binding protein
MQELGYIEGQNLIFETRGARGDFDRFPSLAAELLGSKPELIVAETNLGVLAAMRATTTIPIVMVNVSDPVASGLVASLSRPGGNVTGGSALWTELAGKSVELVRAVLPNAVRLAVLMREAPDPVARFEAIRTAADRFSLSTIAFRVASLRDLDPTFSRMVAQRTDAVIPLAFESTYEQLDSVIALAANSRLPAFYSFGDAVARGALMSYGTSLSGKWKQAAMYVDRILKGAKPADLPVREPMTFELVINRRTAAHLGLTIPPALLLQADRIFT